MVLLKERGMRGGGQERSVSSIGHQASGDRTLILEQPPTLLLLRRRYGMDFLISQLINKPNDLSDVCFTSEMLIY